MSTGALSEGRVLAAVAAGGAIGSLGRWLVGLAASDAVWGTVLVNLTGAFALGLLAVRLEGERLHPLARPFLAVGLLGGWTTYSTFTLDAHRIADDGLTPLLTYLQATIGLWVGAALCGLLVGDRLWGGNETTDAVVTEDEL